MATLNFKGKSAVWNHHLSVPYHTLEKDAKKSLKGENDSENIIIEGDNLLALKALLPQYQGKVKCIYIDPPYNTGNEGWAYNDNVSSPTIKEWVGKVVGKAGEDLTRHDKWLCMMTPRLKLLRELLTEDGSIFVSIDDNEQHHLRDLMDEVFGEQNFVTNIIWQKKYSPQNDAKYFSDMHDFVVVYAKKKNYGNDASGWVRNLISRTEEQDARYKNPDNDPRGSWKAADFSVKTYSKEYDYPVTTPSGRIVNPPAGRAWATSKENFEKWKMDNRIWFGKTGGNVPSVKIFLSEVQAGTVPLTIWLRAEVGDNESAKKEIKELFPEIQLPFETPKPVTLLKKIIQLSTEKNSIILDSFAGSGTTAHAVLEQNKEDVGSRRFILVEMEDYANTITAERVRRAVKKDNTKMGFTYNTLGSSIDAENLLAGKLPSYKEFAKYVYYLATGKNHTDETKIKEQNALVGKGESESIYLIYKPNMEALKTLAITLDWAQEAQKKDKGRKIVYAPACYLDEEMLDQYGIKFVSIPYNLFERAT
ncbi:MAG: site-specific DNA-methyltransferase [Patescibacteria group bacterium]